MISNRNIINLILEIKKQVLQPYYCLIDSLFLIERFYNVKKTKKTDQPWRIVFTKYIYMTSDNNNNSNYEHIG